MRALGELLSSDPFGNIRDGLKGEPGRERLGAETLLEWEALRELELDSFRTVALLLTLALGRKGGGEREEDGNCFVGEAGLDLDWGRADVFPAFKSTLAVTCIERSRGRRGMGRRAVE
jgi:hypothetical protein